MRRTTLILLLLFSAVVLQAGDTGRQRIRLRVLRGDTPLAGVTVNVMYPDGARSCGTCGTKIALQTNSNGYVETDIPTTVFWVGVPAENADVPAREFRFAKIDSQTRSWDLRPGEWKSNKGEKQQ